MEYLAIEVHNEAMKRLDEENARQNKRLDMMEQHLREVESLTTSVEKLALSMETMAKEQIKQGARLEELEGRDGEMWRRVVGYIATFVVGIFATYLFKLIGMA